jgi:hypothetical protein
MQEAPERVTEATPFHSTPQGIPTVVSVRSMWQRGAGNTH